MQQSAADDDEGESKGFDVRTKIKNVRIFTSVLIVITFIMADKSCDQAIKTKRFV
jgi:hypothetical protein